MAKIMQARIFIPLSLVFNLIVKVGLCQLVPPPPPPRICPQIVFPCGAGHSCGPCYHCANASTNLCCLYEYFDTDGICCAKGDVNCLGSCCANFTSPSIVTVGDVYLQMIDFASSGETIPGARFASNNNPPTDPSNANRQSPFGGEIVITGPPVLGYSYSIVARRASQPSSPGAPLTAPITVFDTTLPDPFVVISPDSDGYFNYIDVTHNYNQILASWSTSISDDDLWQIRVVMASLAPHIIVAYTDWYNIKVNNMPPTGQLNFADGSMCGNATVGTTLTGTFDANAAYFASYSMTVTPPLNPVIPSGGLSPVATGTWSLSTVDALPCGYVISLNVYDLAVYNSDPDQRLEYVAYRGFCLSQG